MHESPRFPRYRSRIARLGLVGTLTASMLATSIATISPAVAAQTANDENTTASIAPDDTLAYLSVNLDQESAQWTQAQALFDRAGLTDALTQSGIDPEEITEEASAFTGGYAALVLTSLPADGSVSLDDITTEVAGAATDPAALADGAAVSGFSIVLQADDPDAVETFFLDQLADDAEYVGTTVETETYGDVEISYTEAASTDETGTAIARVDDYVVVAATVDDLEPIIDTANGDEDALADNDDFAKIQDGLNADWLSFGYFDATELIDQLEETSPDVFAEIDESVIDQANGVTGYAIWADAPGFRVDTVTVLENGPASEDEFPTLSGDYASNVSADTLFFANGGNLNRYGILDTVALIFAQELVSTSAGTPVPTDPTDVFEASADTIGFNIKTDFIDQLEGEYGFAVSASDLTSSSPDINAIFAADVTDDDTVNDVADTISLLLTMGAGVELDTREVGTDGEVKTLDLTDSSGVPLVVEYGVVDGQLLVGVNDGIDTWVEGPTASLADDETFQQTFAELPGDATDLYYVNVQQILPIVEEITSAYTGSYSIDDADPSCGEFDTQVEAQAAYDEDSFENYLLDSDFDGTACEDYFVSATPAAEATPSISDINILSVGGVTYLDEDGNIGSSSIILIGE